MIRHAKQIGIDIDNNFEQQLACLIIDKYDNYYRGNGFSAINGNIIIQGATVNATGGSPRGPQRLGRLTVRINNDNTRKNPPTASRQAEGFFF